MSQSKSRLLHTDEVTDHLVDAILNVRRSVAPRPPILCLSGAQGSGKSTLSRRMEAKLNAAGHRGLVLSLDDFYLSLAERSALAEKVHPLAIRRGPPGTHDTERLIETLESLRAGYIDALALPRFDKASDDRSEETTVWEGPASWVIVEGWCLGLSLSSPHEAEEACQIYQTPMSAQWRAWIEAELCKRWRLLDHRFDFKVYLKLPNFEAIVDARWRQEEDLYATTGRRQFQTRSEVADFVSLYEPWTLRMAESAPLWADRVFAVQSGFQYLREH